MVRNHVIRLIEFLQRNRKGRFYQINGGFKMKNRIMKCAITGQECPCKSNDKDEKPCDTCNIGKEWLKDYKPLHDDI